MKEAAMKGVAMEELAVVGARVMPWARETETGCSMQDDMVAKRGGAG